MIWARCLLFVWLVMAAFLLPGVAFGREFEPVDNSPPTYATAGPTFGMQLKPFEQESPDEFEFCPKCGTPFDEHSETFPLRFARWKLLPWNWPLFHPRPGRHQGIGQPLQGESWLYRPFSVGWFMGMEVGGPLIDDWVGQKQGFVGGYRLGWDHNHYWGGEMRFTFSSVELFDSPRAAAAQVAADDEDGWDADDPWRDRFDPRRDVNLFQWDVSVLYYPWGDAAWRPYGLIGLGSARMIFFDRLSERYDKVVFAMPLAIGVKYRCNDWLAMRFELTDNILFAASSGVSTMHELSITGGVEVRFGGSRRAYWPWNPGRHYW